MISMTYDPRRETLRFVWRNIPFVFAAFEPRERPKRNGLSRPSFLVASDREPLASGRRKLRKGGVKLLRSLARINLRAGAPDLAGGSSEVAPGPRSPAPHRPMQASASRLSSARRSRRDSVASRSASPERSTASATHRQPVSHSAAARPSATQARWQAARKALLSGFGASGAPGGQRRRRARSGSADGRDRSAGCAGRRSRSRAPAPTPARHASGRSACQDARQARDAEAEEDDARPGQERAPVERVRQRLAKPSHKSQGGSNRVERTSHGAAIAATPIARLAQAGAATNGTARGSRPRCSGGCRRRWARWARRRGLRRGHQRRRAGDDREPSPECARFSPSRWASASDTPTSARKTLATLCDRSRIGGVKGSIGETSRKSARSQIRW